MKSKILLTVAGIFLSLVATAQVLMETWRTIVGTISPEVLSDIVAFIKTPIHVSTHLNKGDEYCQ